MYSSSLFAILLLGICLVLPHEMFVFSPIAKFFQPSLPISQLSLQPKKPIQVNPRPLFPLLPRYVLPLRSSNTNRQSLNDDYFAVDVKLPAITKSPKIQAVVTKQSVTKQAAQLAPQRNVSSTDQTHEQHMSKLYDLLAEVEKKNNVHIIYAAEAGSREWSIDSRDSDYNVRFVFVRKNFKSYLSLNKTAKLESLEGSSRGRLIDYRGYDISKALRGLSQLNPSLVELIYSSTVYKQDEKRTFVDQVRRVLDSQHRLVPLLDHYRSMAKYYYKNEIETQQNVSLRNYFYVIRPVLMLEWSAHKHHLKATMNDKDKKNSTTGVGHVKLMETNFTLMFNDLKGVMKDEVHAAVMTLLDKKKRSKRTRTVERVKCVDEWIESALADYAKLFARIRDQSATKQQQQQKEQKPNQSSNDVDLHKFDPILHSVLKVKFDDDEQEDRDSWDPDYLD